MPPMTPLSSEFVENCATEMGFRLRGKGMTRIEVFVDAAFAFAVTMLVISFDAIPQTYSEMIEAIKSIPAFLAAVANLMWIWHTHNTWSKRYGLDDATTVALSATFLSVMLIYIYPLRVMLQGMFHWFTDGYLPSQFQLSAYHELANMFIFLGLGSAALSLVLVLMYRHAATRTKELLLNEYEHYETETLQLIWLGSVAISLALAGAAKLIPAPYTPFAGFVFMLFAVVLPWIRIHRVKNGPPIAQS